MQAQKHNPGNPLEIIGPGAALDAPEPATRQNRRRVWVLVHGSGRPAGGSGRSATPRSPTRHPPMAARTESKAAREFKTKYRVTNWPAYGAALRRRRDITVYRPRASRRAGRPQGERAGRDAPTRAGADLHVTAHDALRSWRLGRLCARFSARSAQDFTGKGLGRWPGATARCPGAGGAPSWPNSSAVIQSTTGGLFARSSRLAARTVCPRFSGA